MKQFLVTMFIMDLKPYILNDKILNKLGYPFLYLKKTA